MASTIDRLYDCPKCGESLSHGKLAGRVRYRNCCTEAERFWTRVPDGEGCREYQGARLPKEIGGYGWVSFCGKRMGAHRVAWMLTNGPIPVGLHVLHKCDNGPCCNPNHLFLGTHDQNMKDCMAKGRTTRGARSGSAKITEDQARDILSRKPTKRGRQTWGQRNAENIANEYGVGIGVVYAIWRGHSWSYLQAVTP
jgi:hypothetical protein